MGDLQGHEPLCAAWARGVAATVAPRVRGRRVLELGAGTGGTTRLLAGALRRLPRARRLRPAKQLRCATSCAAGGTLVLDEGAHYSARAPSPLSLVLALFDGWWDAPTSATRVRPGFLAPEEWLSALRRVGYDVPCAQTWADDRREFGGVYCARA